MDEFKICVETDMLNFKAMRDALENREMDEIVAVNHEKVAESIATFNDNLDSLFRLESDINSLLEIQHFVSTEISAQSSLKNAIQIMSDFRLECVNPQALKSTENIESAIRTLKASLIEDLDQINELLSV